MGLTLFLLTALIPLHADTESDITIGKRLTIHSTVHNADRDIWIATPPGYDTSGLRYPVLVITDGAGDFFHAYGLLRNNNNYGLVPRMILVAIPHRDRNHDLTPTQNPHGWTGELSDTLRTSGGAGELLDFMEKDLFPYLETNYRTLPFRVLSGHSFGGLFAMHTFLDRPRLFNGYIAITPSLWWDDQVLLKRAEQRLADLKTDKRFLYMTVGELEHERQVGNIHKMARLLKEQAPGGLTWDYRIMMGEGHGSQGLPAMDDGLRYIFSQWTPDNDVFEEGLDALKHHYSRLETVYGVSVPVPETDVNRLGYRHLRFGELNQALAAMRFNVDRYPNSPNVHDSLGEVYETMDDLASAETCYRKAVELGTESDDPNLGIFKQHLKAIQEKLGK